MERESKVKLHGMWGSTYSKRIELALRIKGIPYEYIEEDLSNKSPELLQYNPVHKKVPVLVHNGNPIAESQVILEYIDETWPHPLLLLPKDPYQRARVRFWASFLHHQLLESLLQLFLSDGEAKEKAIKEQQEKMEITEQGMKEFFPDGRHNIESTNLGLLDILIGAVLSPYEVQEEVLGIKILDPERCPMLFSWVTALNEVPLVKEGLPPHDKLVGLLQNFINARSAPLQNEGV